ncbi:MULTISPECIES: hypothetical protein [unclassified Haematobacter]|uniref:hypothetical protein n=1 Tax=unclassified Haematobacter TaxID=2640585 RepID=UPI0025BF183B|nr:MULTISPECIES: hypothetical protein [unclassified Haematobacter]
MALRTQPNDRVASALNSLSQDELRSPELNPAQMLAWRTPAELFKANILGRGHRRENLS